MLAFLPELLTGFSHNISIFKEMRSIQHILLFLGLLATQLKQILSSASNASFHRFKRYIFGVLHCYTSNLCGCEEVLRSLSYIHFKEQN